MTKPVALITGGTMGIGKAVAAQLQQDHQVVVCARHDAGEFTCDVSCAEQVQDLIYRIIQKYQRLDVLINNAAVYHRSTVVQTTPARWQETLAINLNGVFHCCHYALPQMRQQNYGRIVNLTSYIVKYASPERAAYSVSKLGVIGLTQVLAKEESDYNIKINAVCPGACQTRMDVEHKAVRTPETAAQEICQLARLPASGPTGRCFKDNKEWQISM